MVVISKELVATIVLLFSLQTYSSATVLRIVYNLREATHRILWPSCSVFGIFSAYQATTG